jgi:hypothetical protein
LKELGRKRCPKKLEKEMNQMSSEDVLKIQGSEGNIVL